MRFKELKKKPKKYYNMKVIDYKNVSLGKINYSNPIKNKGSTSLLSKISYNYNNEDIPLYVQTPKLNVASDIVVNNTRTYIELELDKEHINFYEFINNIDDNNIRTTYQNSEEWFDQQLPMDIIDDFYTTPIRMRDYNKAPVIKLKLPVYKNKKSCDIFENNGIPIELNMIKKDIQVICILELKGIKYFKQRFECEWSVVQTQGRHLI